MKKSLMIVTIVAIAIFIGMIIVRPLYLTGDCMEPAVKDGSYVFVNKIIPYLRDYRINDIIIFNYEEKIWISRIVGLENDTIEIQDGKIILNGEVLPKKNIYRDWNNWKYGTYAIEKPLKIPASHVYVLSDKLSAHHDDSRVFGPISKASIIGIKW